MNLTTILLVFFILDGDAYSFAVQTNSATDCIAMQAKIGDVLPEIIKKRPQFYAASCATVKPMITAS